MTSNLDQQIANLKITESDLNTNRKVGPAVPPKPKKPQPQVPKSYSLKKPSEPSYSTLLQNAGGGPTSSSDDKNRLYSNLGPNKSAQSPTYSNILPQHAEKEAQVIYSNIDHSRKDQNTYSNIPAFTQPISNAADDLPPPPEPSDYSQCHTSNFPPPPDDLPPPPSPVSSSYSELRRANYQPDFGTYGPSSQSSAYESIYEPINPRPPSQMSSRSNYSLYAPYMSGSQNKSDEANTAPSLGKEAEVDALTNLLVQSMHDSSDPDDIYGVCTACGQKVVGEGSGCTAMDQVYHISCFTCQHCAIQLQGKPFYALDGKPYCEEDYLNTLEKCSVCMKPILDRILRATGKPYHPQCFTCIVCGKSLDGIPFTVDATNQIHCIEDFHRKFAPRCCVCGLPIMPEPGQDETVRVVALDRSFHIACYKCEDCGLILSSEAEGRGCYPLDDHVLCKSCNAKRVQALTSHMTTEL
ncbi:lipoma-preferred partner homolog [Schistocerca gregaria]|uniref:lipoma-preferred partner homolog n=1 Tax=Schistocerca gregaria TaxID=7010 RepID=UPI00211DA986|nr:lipoma-preferred partner homolog [Schistocerca gregaria]XP_049845639.1 lipoma-preferred partner homolog [Schistocerca gregaria]